MKDQANVLDKDYAFTQLPIPQALAKFMIPTVLSQLAFMLLNLADAFFVGRTGDTSQVAAMTITFPIIMMMNCVTTIFQTGGNAMIATALGNQNKDRAKKISVFCIYTAISIVVIYALIILLFREPLFRMLGASDYSIEHCKDYVFWALIASSIPFTFNQVISQLFLAEGESKIAGFGIAMAGVINIILDPIFVFGLDMGVAGAGAATCISNWIVFVYYQYQYRKRLGVTVLSLNISFYEYRDRIASSVLSVGIPAGLVLFLTNICDFARNYYLGALGSDVELAAWGAVQKISNALMLISVGIAQGVRPLLAYNYAGGLYKRTKDLMKGAMIVMVTYIAVALLLVHIFPAQLVRLFITDKKAISIAVYFIEIWTFALIGLGLIELLNAAFQAFGKWKISLANTVVNKGLLLTPVLILLVKVFGINGIPYSQVITENITMIALMVVYHGISKNLGRVSVEEKVPMADVAIQPSKKGIIITISREHGTAGKQIGKVIAEKLGIPFYYKEATALAAVESGLSKEFISDLNRNSPDILRELYLSTDVVHDAIVAQSKIIQKIAENGSCVIVGRAADYVLRDWEDVYRIFFHAPKEYRMKKVMEMYGDTEEEAMKNIAHSDRAREAYYNNISGKEWGNARNYDLCMDCSGGVEKTAEQVIRILETI